MKRNSIVKNITINSIIAAIYVALSILLMPLSFGTNGIISIRIAEMLMVFALLSPKYFYGLIIGCFITNLFSGFSIDLIIGTSQTALSCLAMYLLRKKPHIAMFISSLICGIIIGLELYILGFSVIGLVIIVTTFVGEMISIELGYFGLYLPFSKKIMELN